MPSATAVALEIYRRAPHPARTAMAGARGWRLRRLRYPAGSERLVAEALERDRSSPEEWRAWQGEQVAALLDRAARLVPHYRDHWRAAGVDPATDIDGLGRWPLTPKAAIREDPSRFVAGDRNPKQLHAVNTSGTSGTPLTIYRHPDDEALHYAIYEARIRRWNGVSRHDPWVIVGGQLVVPFDRTRPPFWVRSAPLNQLYLSSNHLEPANAAAYAAELRSYRPTHLVGYPSSMTVLAQMALDQGLELPRLGVVISNAEPLLDHQIDVLSRAFGCPVRNTYGMSEGVAAGAECEHGSLHLSPDVGLVEIVDDDGRPVPDGTAGEVVATGLVNRTMPLIRYRTGDRAALSPDPCPCGLGAPVVERIEGRTADLIVTPDGRQIFWLNPIFAGLAVRESQIVQRAVDHIEVSIVAAPEWGADHEATLRDRLRQRVGDLTIEVTPVEAIERGPNGKFRPVVSLIDR